MTIGIWYDRLVYDPGISGIDALIRQVINAIRLYHPEIRIIIYCDKNYTEKMFNLFPELNIVVNTEKEVSDNEVDFWICPRPLQPEILDLQKPKVLLLSDMIPAFIDPEGAMNKRQIDVINRLDETENSIIICISRYVKNYHVKKLTSFSYYRTFHLNPPSLYGMDNRVQDFPGLLEMYGLEKNLYAFYPCVPRPYKNVDFVIEATRDTDLKLLLTHPVNNNANHIVCMPPVGYEKLKYLYSQSLCTISASFIEGMVPSPYREGIMLNTPGIAVYKEHFADRLKEERISNSGVLFYFEGDKPAVREHLKDIQRNRDLCVKRQQKMKDLFFSYTWKDYIKDFLELCYDKLRLQNR